MLAKWTEILPLFVVRWLARRHCGYVAGPGGAWYDVRPDVMIRAPNGIA